MSFNPTPIQNIPSPPKQPAWNDSPAGRSSAFNAGQQDHSPQLNFQATDSEAQNAAVDPGFGGAGGYAGSGYPGAGLASQNRPSPPQPALVAPVPGAGVQSPQATGADPYGAYHYNPAGTLMEQSFISGTPASPAATPAGPAMTDKLPATPRYSSQFVKQKFGNNLGES